MADLFAPSSERLDYFEDFYGRIDPSRCVPDFIQFSATGKESVFNLPQVSSHPGASGGDLVGTLPCIRPSPHSCLPRSPYGWISTSSLRHLAKHCAFHQECAVCGCRWISRILFSDALREEHNLLLDKGGSISLCPRCRIVGSHWLRWQIQLGGNSDYVRSNFGGTAPVGSWLRAPTSSKDQSLSDTVRRVELEANHPLEGSLADVYLEQGGIQDNALDSPELGWPTAASLEKSTTVHLWPTVDGQDDFDNALIYHM